jgi:hypothetical protein
VKAHSPAKAPQAAPATRPTTPVVTAPTTTPVVANGTVTPLVQGEAVAATEAAPLVGPVAPQAAVVASGAVAPTALPFTGAPVGLLLLLSGLALGLGAALTRVGARATA